VHGEPNTTNLTVGGEDWKTLYLHDTKHARVGQAEDRRQQRIANWRIQKGTGFRARPNGQSPAFFGENPAENPVKNCLPAELSLDRSS